MFYILTKYEENWRTHLTFRQPHPTPSNKTFSSFKNTILQRPSQNRFLWETRASRSRCKSCFGPRREMVAAWWTLLSHSFGRLRRHFLFDPYFSLASKIIQKNLSYKKFVMIMLIYVIFNDTSVGLGVWGLGGGCGWLGWRRWRPPRKFKKACVRPLIWK